MGSVPWPGCIHPGHERWLQWVPKKVILSWRSTRQLLSWETNFVHAKQTLCGLGSHATSPPKSQGTVNNSVQLFPTFPLRILIFLCVWFRTISSCLCMRHTRRSHLFWQGFALHDSSSRALPSAEKSIPYIRVVTLTSLLGEDVFFLPQEISNRICASPTPCKAKQQQVRPVDTPYKEVEHSLNYSQVQP